MRKGLIVLLAAVLVAAFALPAMADLSTSGFVRVKGHVDQNPSSALTGAFIKPLKDAPTAAFLEQRQRFIFDWNGENVGARAHFEIDFAEWGNSGYAVGRNSGGGLEGDSVNLETKNFYLWFNVPNTSIKVQAGLQSVLDPYDGVLYGTADMAGIFITGKMEPVSYRLAAAKFQEGTTSRDDDVDFYIAEVKFSPTKDAKVGLNFNMIRDASSSSTTTNAPHGGIGGWNLVDQLSFLAADYGWTVTNFAYDPSVFYYIGVDGSFKAGPVALTGWAFYNFGTIEKATTAGTYFGATSADTDVKGYAASLRGDMALGPGKFFLAGAYVSGHGENDQDYKGILTCQNYALAAGFPFYKWDMQLLFPNGDDINSSSALAYDGANKGRGLMAFAAGYSQKFSDQLSGKVGLGYLADAENTVGANAAGIRIKKHKAIEVNANVNYNLLKGIDLGLYGAYAFLTDWESYTGAGGQALANTAGNGFVDGDDIFKFYARANYSF